METLLNNLKKDFSAIVFVAGDATYWNPDQSQVHYRPGKGDNIFGLLHEIGHAQLKHNHYTSDVDLLIKEAQAWEIATVLAKKYQVKLREDYIQDCLETYRDWLYTRSICPHCTITGVEFESQKYTCLNCRQIWSVSDSRFCRAYRMTV